MLELFTVQPDDLPACRALAHRALMRECAVNPDLAALAQGAPEPDFFGLTGLAAREGGALAGFLLFTPPFDGAFGRCRGVFSPVHANAFFGSDPERTLTALTGEALRRCAQRGVQSVAIGRYAHERGTLTALALAGWGGRCCDLVRRTGRVSAALLPGYILRRAEPDDLAAVWALEQALCAHMESSPVFLPQARRDADALARAVRSGEEQVYAAFSGGQAAAYLLVGRGGETWLDRNPHSRHIAGAYCRPEARGSGVMAALTDYADADLHRRGAALLGVDCETLNPPAYRFWRRHFSPFTYSFVRRLDERCARPVGEFGDADPFGLIL